MTGATRDAVLDAATRLFGTTGFRGTSLGDVAKAAGLSNAGLLHHFPSKEQLLIEVLRQRDLRDRIEFNIGRQPDIGIWELLAALVDLAAANSHRPGLVRLYTTVAGEATDGAHPAHGWLRDHLGVSVSGLKAAFEAGKDAGVIRRDAPSASLARQCIALLDGLQIQWLAFQSAADTALPAADVQAATDALASDEMLAAEEMLAADEMSGDVGIFVDGLRGRWGLPGPVDNVSGPATPN